MSDFDVDGADGFGGFHHSWLGDASAVKSKLLSYAHALSDHSAAIVDDATGEVSLSKLKALVEDQKSIFDGHDLRVRTLREQPLLPSIMANLDRFRHLLIEQGAD